MKELSIEEKARRYDEALAMAKECITYVPDEAVNKYMQEEWSRRLSFEKKSVDKVEPKFHEGDWVAINPELRFASPLCIKDIDNNNYRVESLYGGSGVPTIDYLDNHYHLWTIEDAKDGDILHSVGFYNDCIFIFNGLDNWKFDASDLNKAVVATGYCCLFVSANNIEFGIQGPDYIEVNTVKPATPIQRNLLFTKMKEAGYKWNADKKELIKL